MKRALSGGREDLGQGKPRQPSAAAGGRAGAARPGGGLPPFRGRRTAAALLPPASAFNSFALCQNRPCCFKRARALRCQPFCRQRCACGGRVCGRGRRPPKAAGPGPPLSGQGKAGGGRARAWAAPRAACCAQRATAAGRAAGPRVAGPGAHPAEELRSRRRRRRRGLPVRGKEEV